MSTTMKRLTAERYAREHAQGALRGAARNLGVTYADVGRRLSPPKTQSAVAHDVTDRVHPEMHEDFRRLIGLCGSVDGVSARRYAELVMETVDIRELLEADRATLIERGCYLMAARHRLNAEETAAGEARTKCFPAKLRAESWAQIELAQIHEVLEDVYGVDLDVEYARRGAAA